MVNYNFRRISNYTNLVVEIDGFKKDVGLLDKKELTALRDHLIETVDDINRHLED